MENMDLVVKGDKLVITVDLTAPGVLSSTGKMKLVASSRGAVPIAYSKRPGLTVALNLMAPK